MKQSCITLILFLRKMRKPKKEYLNFIIPFQLWITAWEYHWIVFRLLKSLRRREDEVEESVINEEKQSGHIFSLFPQTKIKIPKLRVAVT